MAVSPCSNPRVCGVASHRVGTEAHRRCGVAQPGTGTGAGKLGAAPKLAASEQSTTSSVSGAEVRELIEESMVLGAEMTRLAKQGSEQVEAGVRKDLNLAERDEVIVNTASLLYPNDRVSVKITKVGERPMQYVQRKSRYLPEKPQEGKASMEDIKKLDRDQSALSDRREKMVEQGQKAVEAWVANRNTAIEYEEVRTHAPNVVGESEFISARLYRGGREVGYYRIMRGDIFPE